MRARLGTLVLVLGLVSSFGAACGKKKSADADRPPPEVTGLAAVPASAQVLIAADVTKLSDSALVSRAVDQLLLRDMQLATRWADVKDSCKIDLTKQVKRVMLALGPTPQTQPTGTGPVLMVATGQLVEADLAACVRTLVGKGGGSLTVKTVAGRSIYEVKDGNRTMLFAFGRPDTVVLSTNEAWLTEALGAGQKAPDAPELKALFPLIDQNAPLWAIGKVDERVRQGLVNASGGQLKAGPQAIVGTVDPTDGAKLSLGAVMATADDAKSLETFANNELKVVAMVAQMKSLGPIVAKVAVQAEGTVVRFRAPLSVEDVNQLLSVLDEKPASEQVTQPPEAPK